MNKMKEETDLAREQVAKEAYALYLREGRPQGHSVQNWLEAEAQIKHACTDHSGHSRHAGHSDHHAHMAADFRKRF